MSDLFGLAIGFGLGGAVLVRFLPAIEAALRPAPPPAEVAQRAPTNALVPPPAIPQPAPSDRVTTLPAPAELPQVLSPDLSPDEAARPPLPVVVGPTRPRTSAGKAGTGFFIADDGSLLTAAHVVSDCRRMEVLSRFVRPAAVDLLASDPKQDIALLRTRHVRPPGILSLGRPASRRMVVFGYPASAGPTIPEETLATLENDKFPQPLNTLTDPRDLVWIEAAAVTHGYSGGPILDPDNGAVIGIVKGTIEGGRLRFVRGMPTSGVAIGPGAGRLASFLHQAAPDLEMATPYDTGDTVVDDARRATVHVVCWY
jgi:S1-C subfamily serine protease